MKAGDAPQCIRVEVDQVKPIASGWGGALALTDGKTRIWFHNPDSDGWVHPLGDHAKAAIDDQVKSGHREKA